jgi:hypothetical protein
LLLIATNNAGTGFEPSNSQTVPSSFFGSVEVVSMQNEITLRNACRWQCYFRHQPLSMENGLRSLPKESICNIQKIEALS